MISIAATPAPDGSSSYSRDKTVLQLAPAKRILR
jgi:hypothetical protein